METRFKVGDKVVGNQLANALYRYTCEGSVCLVRDIIGNILEVEIISSPNIIYSHNGTFQVMSYAFNLYNESAKPSKNDLLLLKIKTKYKK